MVAIGAPPVNHPTTSTITCGHPPTAVKSTAPSDPTFTTVPFARVIAQYRDLPRPFRRYQFQRVWRGENTQRGRYREFMQCDFDTIGTLALFTFDKSLGDAFPGQLAGLGMALGGMLAGSLMPQLIGDHRARQAALA